MTLVFWNDFSRPCWRKIHAMPYVPDASAPTSQDMLPKVTLVWKLSLHLYYADAFSYTRLTYSLLEKRNTA